MTHTEIDPEQILRQRGILLPTLAKPLGNYAPYAVTGNWIFTSGQLPWADGELAYRGKLGSDLAIDQGYEASRIAALNAIAQIRNGLGSLSRVSQIVRLAGTFQVAPGFRDHPKALDGASDVINLIFGAAGRHTRMISTSTEMPLDTPVLIELQAEFR